MTDEMMEKSGLVVVSPEEVNVQY